MQHECGIWSCKRPQSAVHTTWSLQKQIGKPGQSRSIIIFCSYFRQNVFTAIIWPLTEWDHFLPVCAFQHFIFPPSVSFILKSSFFPPSFFYPPPRLFFYLFLFPLFVYPHPNLTAIHKLFLSESQNIEREQFLLFRILHAFQQQHPVRKARQSMNKWSPCGRFIYRQQHRENWRQ